MTSSYSSGTRVITCSTLLMNGHTWWAQVVVQTLPTREREEHRFEVPGAEDALQAEMHAMRWALERYPPQGRGSY